MANDNKVIGFMRARIRKLEQELKCVEGELDRMRVRPDLPTQREDYLLGEMEIANRQLKCKRSCCFASDRSFPVLLVDPFLRCCRLCSRLLGGAGTC